MSSSRRASNGRSPLVNPQRQITSFFTKKPTGDNSIDKSNPDSHSNLSPTPSPSPSTNSPSSVQSKRKKTPLVIGGGGAASSSPAPSPIAPVKEKSYGDGVVGKRVKVYWPLDKSWYEGRVKMFDEKAGKHLVQYDDAEEESLVLGNEKIEWVEESAKKFKRLRRGSSSPMGAAVVEDMVEDLNDGDDSDDSRDEDWGKGKNVENEVSDEEDVELVEEDEEETEDDGVGKSRRKQGGKVEFKKRKMSSNGEKVEGNPKKSNSSGGNVPSGGFRLSSVEPKIKSESE